MADSDFTYVPNPTPETNENPTWADYGKTAAAGALSGVAAPAVAGARAATEGSETTEGQLVNGLAKVLQKHINAEASDLNESRTEVARKRAEAAISDPDFLAHPVSSVALKATGMAGPLAAAAITGGPVGAAIVGAALAGGSYENDLDQKLDGASDEDLQKNDYYRAMRQSGVEEDDARKKLKTKVAGYAPYFNMLAGAVAGALGPAAKLAGASGFASEEAGVLGRAAFGGGEGAVGGAIQSGVSDITQQQADIDLAKRQGIDVDALTSHVLEGGVLGGVLGAGASAVAGGKKSAKAKDSTPIEETDRVPDNNQTAPKQGRGDADAAVEAQTTGGPAGTTNNIAPTASPPEGKGKAKAKQVKAKNGPQVETVNPGTPDAATALAIGDKQQPTPPIVPDDVAAAAQRVAAATPKPAPADPALAQPAPDQAAPAPQPAPQAQGQAPGVAGQAAPAPEPASGARPSSELPPKPSVPDTQPTPQAVTPEVTSELPPKRAPQVLQAIKDKATQEAEAKANRDAMRKANKNAKQVAEIEANGGEPVVKGKNWTKDEIAQREASAEGAKKVFEDHAPEEAVIPTDKAGYDALRERLGNMLAAADEAGVKIPAKVGYEGTPDHVVYLRDAKDLHTALGQKSFVGAKRTKRITDFLIAERAAKEGDFSVLRERRKLEGELAKRKAPDVEKAELAAAAGDQTAAGNVAASGKGRVRLEESEGAASEGKVLKGEAKAKAIAEFNARQAKGKVEANALDRAAAKEIPEATSAKVVDRAARDTNTEPSDAQKAAGNYEKAVVKWHGLDFAIENPKGSIRKGNGWQTEMPDHYGYIKRTEGSDGDAVDAYMGPNPKSEHVFVIHQQDFEGKFDEHKAMLGYDTLADAYKAYDKAFSDGRGFERIKDVEPMSVDEFKKWVKSDAPKKARSEPANKEPIDAALRNAVPDYSGKSGGEITTQRAGRARDILKELDLSHLSGVPKAIAEMARKHFQTMVGDTEVHVVTPEQMAAIRDNLDEALSPETGTRGLLRLDPRSGKPTVVIREDQFSNPAELSHVVLHEMAHAWTLRALVEDRNLYRQANRMLAEVKDFLTELPDVKKKIAYAFENEREFIAEAMSNPEVQDVLSAVPLSKELAQALGLHRQKPSMWDAIVGMVRSVVEKMTGRMPQGHSVIEGVLRMAGDFDRHINVQKARRLSGRETPVQMHEAFSEAPLMAKAKEKIDDIRERFDGHGQEGRPLGMKLRTMDQIAQLARDHAMPQVRRLADLMEMTRMKSMALLKKSEPIVTKMYELERKYKGDVWDKFTSLVHDETMTGVFSDRDLSTQTHLGKEALKGLWGKANHAQLSARYKELPEDLKAARAEAMKFFTDQQNAMSLGLIKNHVLKLLDVNDDALARRIHEGNTTDADAATVGGEDVLKRIKEVKALSKIEGPYFPLMRRGEYAVYGRHEVTLPSNALKVEGSPNQFDFTSRKDVEAWVKQHAEDGGVRPDIKSLWVDKNTGLTRFEDGEGPKVTKQDDDAEQRFRVTLQDKHVEFAQTRSEGLKKAEALKEAGLKDTGTERRKLEGGPGSDLTSLQMQTLADTLKRRDSYKGMTKEQQVNVMNALNEASLRLLSSTRIQTKRLPRRYVAGASEDLTQNTWDYAQSTAGYLAKLEHQPQLDEATKAMNDAVRVNDNKTSVTTRSEIAREVNERLAQPGYAPQTKFGEVTRRIMTLSFLDKLFSPAFNVVNSLQPAMVTMPVLAGRYGVGRSFDAITRAYRDISALSVVGKGVKDTISKIKGDDAETNFLDEIKSRLKNPREREMLDYLAERGSIDRESGMEIGQLIKARKGAMGKLDTGIGYMEGIARQMPQAIEMMNRAVTALASYRLEMLRGAKHEDAMRIAQEHVNNTQGLYSATNAAPIFNHPVAKLALQFKKYGQMMYHLLGQNVGKALKGATPEERAQALKTLAGLAATHAAMAGALGLPTEPFKALLWGANAVGLSSTSMNDVENKVREYAAQTLGKTAGEIVTKGLPHAIGIDLSSRVGMDTLLTFGEPNSAKASDVWAFFGKQIAGAPGSLIGDWVSGANALGHGDFQKAAELLVPNKFAADSIKAYRLATEGKKSASGQEKMKPYSPVEAAVRAFGFTPSREEEAGAKSGAIYNASQSQKTERGALVNGWVNAKPSEKTKAWSAIQKWNAGAPKEARVTLSELSSASSRRKSPTAGQGSKRDKDIRARADATYNVEN